jgi:hypothetical protein
MKMTSRTMESAKEKPAFDGQRIKQNRYKARPTHRDERSLSAVLFQ